MATARSTSRRQQPKDPKNMKSKSSIPSSSLSSSSTSSSNTYLVGKQLLDSGKWALYLSPEQLPILSLALESETTWDSFCHDPTCIMDSLTDVIEEPVLSNWGSLESLLTVTAFRIRSMIFEQYLPLICNDEAKPYCTASVDLNQLNSTAKPSSSSTSSLLSIPTANNNNVDPMVSASVKDLPPEKIASRLSDYIPIDDIYHTIEDEIEAKHSYQKYGISHNANDADKNNSGMDSEMVMRGAGDVSQVTINNKQTGNAQQQQQLSTNAFKYLLEAVAAVNDAKAVAKMRAILTDFRPRKSKWSSEDKVGQEDLYEACENVLDALRKYEHSWPFLTKVNPKDAPDYYDIIKNPMDLGTAKRKLSKLAYQSKKEFIDDLNLIWDNCLIYNQMPDSIYRKAAILMKKKANELCASIPDITVRERRPGDEDLDEMEIDEEDESLLSPTNAPTVGSPPVIANETAAHVAGLASPGRNGPEDTTTFPRQGSPSKEVSGGVEVNEETLDVQYLRWRNTTWKSRGRRLIEMEKLISKPVPDRPVVDSTSEDLGLMVTSEKKFVARNNMRRRVDLLEVAIDTVGHKDDDDVGAVADDDKDGIAQRQDERREQSNRDVNGENNEGGESGADGVAEKDDKEHDEEERQNKTGDKKRSSLLETPQIPDEDWYCPEANVGLPNIRQQGGVHVGKGVVMKGERLFKGRRSWNVPSMSEFSELLPDAKSPMVQQIRQNRREISQIKELHAKILAKMAGWDWFSNELQLEPYQPHWKPQDLPPLNLTPRTSGSVMRNITGELLNHSGFDLADELCLDMLTDVGVLYMDKMAKLLKSYMEKYGNSLQPTNIMHHVLSECNVAPKDLEDYVNKDIIRYGTRVQDLRVKLDYAFGELTRVLTTGNEAGEGSGEDVDLDKMRDEMVIGSLTEELGIDMLGLKELGLGVTSVPTALWNKKAENPVKPKVRVRWELVSQVSQSAGSTSVAKAVLPDVSFSPVNIASVIGLLKPFFQSRLQQDGGVELVDDEAKPKSKSQLQKRQYLIKTATTIPKKRKEESGVSGKMTPTTVGPDGEYTVVPEVKKKSKKKKEKKVVAQ